MRKRKLFITMQLIIVFIIVSALLYFINIYGVQHLLSLSSDNLLITTLLVLMLYALKSVVMLFPVIAIQIAVANIFTPFVAILINVVGTFIAVSIPYFFAYKYVVNPINLLNKSNSKIDKVLCYKSNNEVEFVAIARLSGLSMELISILMGALKINYGKYLIGSFLGTIGYIISFTMLGSNILDPFSKEFLYSLIFTIFIFIMSIAILKIYKYVNKKTNKLKNDVL